MSVKIDLRISALVRKAHRVAGGRWQRLEADIEAISWNRHRVDRRKLKRIADAESALVGDDADDGDIERKGKVTLSVEDMLALQSYFVSKRMLRLDDNMLFEFPESILSGFRGATDLTIFLPTRYVEAIDTECASRWDVRAVEQLLRAPQLAGLPVDMEDVFHAGGTTDGAGLREKIADEAWYRKLDNRDIVCLSSPFVSYATESLLCIATGIENAFEYPGDELGRTLPFRFYWPDRHRMSPSAFSITRDQIAAELGALPDNFVEDERGLLVDGQYYAADADSRSFDLIVARRHKDQFVLILSAIHAPATLGIANCVWRGDVPMSRADAQRPSDFVYIAVAETKFNRNPDDVGRDRRTWLETNLVEGQPRLWNRRTRRWAD